MEKILSKAAAGPLEAPFKLRRNKRPLRTQPKLTLLFIIQIVVQKTVVLGGQNLVELFNEDQELFPIFFQRDQQAEFLNTIAISFVHERSAPPSSRENRVYLNMASGKGMFAVEQ